MVTVLLLATAAIALLIATVGHMELVPIPVLNAEHQQPGIKPQQPFRIAWGAVPVTSGTPDGVGLET